MTESLDEVLARHTPHLMSIPGVVGTGHGVHGDAPRIIVFVEEKTVEIEDAIPSRLEGYEVRIEEVGEIGPLS